MARSESGAEATCAPVSRIEPVIDRNRCEGKSDCLIVCPYDVFEIRPLSGNEKSALSLVGRLKLKAHGGHQSFVVRAADCQACGQCVKACPENAIQLMKRPTEVTPGT